MDRIRELRDASVPFNFDVHALFFSKDAVGLEAAILDDQPEAKRETRAKYQLYRYARALSARTTIPLSRFGLAHFDERDYFEVAIEPERQLTAAADSAVACVRHFSIYWIGLTTHNVTTKESPRMNVNATLQKALSQLEAERKQIDKRIAAIRDVLGSNPRGQRKKAGTTGGRRSKRRMTAAQRKAISRRMKKFWAGRRKAQAAKS